MLRRLVFWLLALAAPVPALAHPDGMWPDPPTLTPAQAARVDRLAARAVAWFARRPAAERAGRGAWLSSALIGVGQCRRAEQQMRANPPLPAYMSWTVIEAAGARDPDCVDRMLALAAATPAWQIETSSDPNELHYAGALWRRLGRRPQGEAAIAAAERRLDQLDASDEHAWMCHGGDCLARLWGTRLLGLRLYHGTDLYSEELHRLAALAFEDRRADESGRGPRRIGQRVFNELFWAAMNEGETALAEQLTPFTRFGRHAIARARMTLLIGQGRVDEALALWPVVAPNFHDPIDRDMVRAHPEAFHRWRQQFRPWRYSRDAEELLALLPSVWIELGNRERAAEALATARADIAAGGGQSAGGDRWGPALRGRLDAVEAQLEGGADPVAWLAARDVAGDRPARDHGFAELAAGLAIAGRPEQARRAIALIRESPIRHRARMELPCRAAAGGDAAARAAVDLAAGALAPLDASRDAGSAFRGLANGTFRCLIRAGRGEAALAYASAIPDPRLRLDLLSTIPPNGVVSDVADLRRRFAERAFALARQHGLWDEPAIAWLAADFEQLGDFRRVDSILARARGDEIRRTIFEKLLESYAAAAD